MERLDNFCDLAAGTCSEHDGETRGQEVLRCLLGKFANDRSASIGSLVQFRNIRARDFSISCAVSALVRIAPSGWLISWAIEALSSPAVEKRTTRASSVRRSRDCASAN